MARCGSPTTRCPAPAGCGAPSRNVAKWNGAQWDSLGAGLGSDYYEYVKAFAEYGDTLVAGGTFPGAVKRWDGGAWTPAPAQLEMLPPAS